MGDLFRHLGQAVGGGLHILFHGRQRAVVGPHAVRDRPVEQFGLALENALDDTVVVHGLGDGPTRIDVGQRALLVVQVQVGHAQRRVFLDHYARFTGE